MTNLEVETNKDQDMDILAIMACHNQQCWIRHTVKCATQKCKHACTWTNVQDIVFHNATLHKSLHAYG